MDTITLAIAAAQPIFRAGLIAILQNIPDMTLILEAKNSEELIEKLSGMQPRVILLDLEMPVMSGMDAARHIRKKDPDIRLLVFTHHEDDAFLMHMLEIGVNGYLLKSAQPEEIPAAIRRVVENPYDFNDRISQTLLSRLLIPKPAATALPKPAALSDRETEVLRYICQELNSQEIADQMRIGRRTVEGYRQNLMDKTGAKNTAGLVMFAWKNGYVQA